MLQNKEPLPLWPLSGVPSIFPLVHDLFKILPAANHDIAVGLPLNQLNGLEMNHFQYR